MKIQIEGEKLEFEIKNFNSKSRIHFILKGIHGAVVISYWSYLNSLDLNIHSKKPLREDHKTDGEICEYINAPCYCDGRYLNKSVDEVDFLQVLKNEYNYIKRATK